MAYMDGLEMGEDFVHTDVIKSSVSTEAIKRLRPKRPLTLSENASLDEAINLMQVKKIGAVLLLDEQQNLSGIFTERDLLLKVVNQSIDTAQTALKHMMTAKPETLTEDDKIVYALNRMTVGGYRHIPIVNDSHELTGIISVKDIVEFLVGLVEEEVYNLRPEPLRKGFAQAEGG